MTFFLKKWISYTKSKWKIPHANMNIAEKIVEIVNAQNTSDDSWKKLEISVFNSWEIWRISKIYSFWSLTFELKHGNLSIFLKENYDFYCHQIDRFHERIVETSCKMLDGVEMIKRIVLWMLNARMQKQYRQKYRKVLRQHNQAKCLDPRARCKYLENWDYRTNIKKWHNHKLILFLLLSLTL